MPGRAPWEWTRVSQEAEKRGQRMAQSLYLGILGKEWVRQGRFLESIED